MSDARGVGKAEDSICRAPGFESCNPRISLDLFYAVKTICLKGARCLTSCNVVQLVRRVFEELEVSSLIPCIPKSLTFFNRSMLRGFLLAEVAIGGRGPQTSWP